MAKLKVGSYKDYTTETLPMLLFLLTSIAGLTMTVWFMEDVPLWLKIAVTILTPCLLVFVYFRNNDYYSEQECKSKLLMSDELFYNLFRSNSFKVTSYPYYKRDNYGLYRDNEVLEAPGIVVRFDFDRSNNKYDVYINGVSVKSCPRKRFLLEKLDSLIKEEELEFYRDKLDQISKDFVS